MVACVLKHNPLPQYCKSTVSLWCVFVWTTIYYIWKTRVSKTPRTLFSKPTYSYNVALYLPHQWVSSQWVTFKCVTQSLWWTDDMCRTLQHKLSNACWEEAQPWLDLEEQQKEDRMTNYLPILFLFSTVSFICSLLASFLLIACFFNEEKNWKPINTLN